jgi:hypothetical protein
MKNSVIAASKYILFLVKDFPRQPRTSHPSAHAFATSLIPSHDGSFTFANHYSSHRIRWLAPTLMLMLIPSHDENLPLRQPFHNRRIRRLRPTRLPISSHDENPVHQPPLQTPQPSAMRFRARH